MSQERDGWVQGILCGLCRLPPQRLVQLQPFEGGSCHGHALPDLMEYWQDTSTLVLADNQLATDVMVVVKR